MQSTNFALLQVRVHSVCSLLTTVCVHLDGLNAEHQFRVWVTYFLSVIHLFSGFFDE